jgi:hypothetical protein
MPRLKEPMTSSFHRSLRLSVLSFRNYAGIALVLLLAILVPAARAATPIDTTTTLAISSNSVPYRTPIILTATVTETISGSPVSAGFVLFCDATATFCENNSALGRVQLTAANATAIVKIGSGPQGIHKYKAVYRANNIYASSVSTPVSYTVQGTDSTTTTVASSGSVGKYTLIGNVTGVGSPLAAPSGDISFIDTSAGNKILGTEALGAGVLNETFTQAPNSPFSIALLPSDSSTDYSRSVAIASDYIDGDNNLDVVTGNTIDHTVTVLMGNGDGSFQPKVNYSGCVTGNAMKILLADFNRDGNIDIALGCSDNTNGGLVILLGNGGGKFQSPVSYPSGDVAGLAMGDFNGDGVLDIVVTDHKQKDVTIFIGNGDGTFKAGAIAESTQTAANDVVVADFDGDGNDDLAFAVNASNSSNNIWSDLYVASGKGDGTFNTPVLVASNIGEFLTVGDTNGDNLPDIVSTTVQLAHSSGQNVGNSLFVLIGNGKKTIFQPAVTYVSDIPSDPHLADVNGDGKPDIIAGGSYGALVYLGKGNGTFQAYTEPVIGGFALTYAVNAGDYNNDGNADLIGTDARNPQAAVSLSEVQQVADASALTGVALLPLGSGTHYIDATYLGDSIYVGGTSSTIPLLAAPTPTTLSLTVSPTSGTVAGQPVTLTATLDPYTVGPPTTTTDGGSVKFFNGATYLGSGTLSSGVATLTTTTLLPGGDALQAAYPGDTNGNYNPSSSNSVKVTVSGILLASSPNPSVYRQTVTFVATVPSGELGSVTFNDGGTALGTVALSGSTASFTTSTLTAGSHDVTAVYSGDTSHGTPAATSPIVTQVVNMVTPSLVVTTSGPSNYGDPVTITVTVSPGASGSVTITSGGNPIGTGTISPTGTVTITTTTLPVGTDTITVNYGGDGNNNSANGTTNQTVSKANPLITLSSSINPSMVNQSVTFTATVPTTVSGTVTFFDGATALDTATVSKGSASITTSTLLAGSHTVTASYSGDSNDNSATSLPLTQTVNKQNPVLPAPSVSSNNINVGGSEIITETVPSGVTGPVTFYEGSTPIGTGSIVGGVATITINTLPVGSDPITATTPADADNNSATSPATVVTVSKTTPTITLISSNNPSSYGQSVMFTATTPSTGATGTVVFLDGTTALGTVNLTSGQASFTTSSLTAGVHTMTADYSGDPSYNTANSSALTQTVNKGSPALPPPAVSASTLPSGSSESISEAVPSGVTGPVTFYDGSTVIGTAPIVNGVATITVTMVNVGTDSITASTPADTNNNAATSPATSVTVTKMTPSLPPPTVSTTTPTPDTPVTITEQVPPGVTEPVTFYDGPTAIGTAPVVNGVATITVPSLPLGPNPITAATPGGNTSNAATSPVTPVVVSKTIPTVTLTSSANPADFNQSVTFTATIPAAASGTVTFRDGAVVLGTGAINSAGIAILTTSNLAIGSHTITASYGGNSTYDVATSAPLAEVIGKIPTAVTLTQSAASQLLHNTVTFAATVTAASPTPTGTVTFLEGTTVLGITALDTNGTVVALAKSAGAAYATSALATGSHQIVAVYSGDASFAASTSAPVTYIVQDFTNAVNGTANQNVFPGDKTSYKFDLAPLGANTFLSDLNLTVTGLPPGTTYTFTPATITAGSGTTSVVLDITTSNSLSAQNRMPKGDPMSQRGLPIALGMLGLFGLGVVRKHGRRMPRMLVVFLLLLGSLLPVAGLSGCAGGYFTLTPTTYSVSVTGTEGSIQHTATATLVVQ